MSIWRVALGLISGGAAIFGAGRHIARNRVEKKIEKIIADVTALARNRVEEGASVYLNKAWKEFLLTSALKALTVAMLWGLSVTGFIPKRASLVSCAVLLAGWLIYDVYKRRAAIATTVKWLRRTGLRPRLVLKRIVTERVFVETLQEALAEKPGRAQRALFYLTGHQSDDVAERIARAVSEAAGETAWQDIRPFLGVAISRFVILSFIYSAIIWLMLRQISSL